MFVSQAHFKVSDRLHSHSRSSAVARLSSSTMSDLDDELKNEGRRSQLRSKIYDKLVETGEKTRLSNYLHEQLHACGWINMVRQECEKLLMRDPTSESFLSIEDIVATLLPDIRAAVPEPLKMELLHRVQVFIGKHGLDITR